MEYGEVLGRMMAVRFAPFVRKWQITAVVPVPMPARRKRMRGYNQAEVLADIFGRQTGLPVRTDLAVRTGNGSQRAKMNARERREASSGAFAPGEGSARGERIAVIDDVYTTGWTADALAGVLLENGAAVVYVLTLCISGGYRTGPGTFFAKIPL